MLHKLRSGLTMLGIVFGVFSVIAMLAIGEGASTQAQKQIVALGATNIIVSSTKPPDDISTASRTFVARYGVEPARALMIEDMARNLAPAAELGVTTAWVRTSVDWAAIASDADYIHHIVDDLAGFLAAAVAQQSPLSEPAKT